MAQLIPPQEPPKLLTAEEILPTMRRIVDEKRALRDEIVRSQNSTTASFANTILPIIEGENRSSGEFTMIVLISFASPLPESRAAAKDALKLASEASASNLARRDLFALVDAVKNNGEALDEESRRYVDMLWSKYRRSGHGVLDDEQIQKFAKSQNEVVHLRRQYIHNTMANNEGCWLAREDLDGLPEKWQHRYIAETPAEDSNRVFIPFKQTESEVFLNYCRNPATRKQFSVARSRSLAENVSIFREVIMKRYENAIMLLLFENWCWMPTTLQKMSRHYTSLDPKYLSQWQENHAGLPPPPNKLPETEIQRLICSRNHQTVHWYPIQMFYSRFDMALHSCNSLQECINIDPAKLFYELQGKLRLLPIADRADWGHHEANFRHLVKGHDAGLYSYLSAHVAATNIFSKTFIDDPFNQEAWNGYRSGLLAWGSSRDERRLLQELLGVIVSKVC